MRVAQDEVDELKHMFGEIVYAEEVNLPYLLLPKMTLPKGCEPAVTDVLLCPVTHSGYPSRLFYPQQVKTGSPRNWNGQFRILDRNWVTFSWNIQAKSPRLAQMVALHLRALR